MQCPMCSSNVAVMKTRNHVHKTANGELIVITDVPVISCRECARDSLDGVTLDTIDEIRHHPETYCIVTNVGVANFSNAIHEPRQVTEKKRANPRRKRST